MREDDIRCIQMRPRSLPADPVSYPITTATRAKERASTERMLGTQVGVEQRAQKKKRGVFWCLLEPFTEMLHVPLPR